MSEVDAIDPPPDAAGTLPPTATYPERGWRWRRDPTGAVAGWLTILVRRGTRVERDTYAVEPVENVSRRVRAFLLLNVTDPAQADVYAVVIGGPRGDECTCKAAACGVPNCKHRDAVKDLIAKGHL